MLAEGDQCFFTFRPRAIQKVPPPGDCVIIVSLFPLLQLRILHRLSNNVVEIQAGLRFSEEAMGSSSCS